MYPKPTNGVNTDYQAAVGAAIDAINARLKGNLIDNGAFQVWQRGTSIAASASGAVFTADRWALVRGGLATGATVTQQAGGNARYCARVQRDNANGSAAAILFAHTLETDSSIPCRGKDVALGFRARMGANYSAAGAALVATITSGTGTDQSINTGFTGSATVATQSFTLTASFQDFLLLGTPGASINQLGLTFAFTPVGTAGAADYFEIEQIQLVRGDYVGDFPYRSDAEELMVCQRFFSKSFPYATVPAQNAGVTGSNVVQCAGASLPVYANVRFPSRMRAAPTVTLYNPSAANAQARNVEAAADYTSTSTFDVSELSAMLTATASAGMTAGQSCRVHWSATAEI